MTVQEPVPHRKRFLLLHNPVAGVRRRTLARRVAVELERRGAEIVMLRFWGATSTAPGAIARDVQLDGFDAVIAAGGDGTVRALATALGENTTIPIGIIATGTGNVLANEIAMPKKPTEIAEVLMTGPVVSVAGALANKDPFFLMAGAGFDGEIVAGLDLSLKRRIGKLAYAMPILKALAKRPKMFSLTVDGKAFEASWLVVANGRNYAGTYVIAPEASLSETGFQALLFAARTRRGRLLELLSVAAGLHMRLPSVKIIPCQHLTVAGSDIAVQADGDQIADSPLTVTSAGPRLRLIAPPAFANGLVVA
ncbi:Diacylglycerol kinase family enzyme [Filomicrobium insigne]|uniref:Diacylglycerol kinase family enzyme n=1 Tax=Filomicrobium insigne TaxID=418854 RepID=A0A1H0HD26_9HYPH|nr:diacylglycerol kinase family protein [Filomicrobium insigne]SDO17048.1 Diacylglycerol kinase family enzyme [Filomicrobium insigne]